MYLVLFFKGIDKVLLSNVLREGIHQSLWVVANESINQFLHVCKK